MEVARLQKLDEYLSQGPASHCRDDIWARLCCQQALLALESGSYGVGAVIVDRSNELVCVAHNSVFSPGYQSGKHAEMEVLNILEQDFSHLKRHDLTLYVSLEPCLMCTGRILLSGIGQVRYLAKDKAGGFATHMHLLPPAWKNLASQLIVEHAKVDRFWSDLALTMVEEQSDQMRKKVVSAWQASVDERL